MPIYATNFIVNGTANNSPIYTNKLAMNGYSNMSIDSDLAVSGDIYSTGRLDVGTTIHATLKLTSNVSFHDAVNNEITISDNRMIMDWNETNTHNMNTIPMAISPNMIYNSSNGIITVPTSGMYSIHLQASFLNTGGFNNPSNGVYFRFPDSSSPNARIAGQISSGNIVGTSLMRFLNAGEHIVPTIYSNDQNASILANGETYLTWMVAATYTTNA